MDTCNLWEMGPFTMKKTSAKSRKRLTPIKQFKLPNLAVNFNRKTSNVCIRNVYFRYAEKITCTYRFNDVQPRTGV